MANRHPGSGEFYGYQVEPAEGLTQPLPAQPGRRRPNEVPFFPGTQTGFRWKRTRPAGGTNFHKNDVTSLASNNVEFSPGEPDIAVQNLPTAALQVTDRNLFGGPAPFHPETRGGRFGGHAVSVHPRGS